MSNNFVLINYAAVLSPSLLLGKSTFSQKIQSQFRIPTLSENMSPILSLIDRPNCLPRIRRSTESCFPRLLPEYIGNNFVYYSRPQPIKPPSKSVMKLHFPCQLHEPSQFSLNMFPKSLLPYCLSSCSGYGQALLFAGRQCNNSSRFGAPLKISSW